MEREVVLSSPRRPAALALSIGILILLVATAGLSESFVPLLLFGVPQIWRVVAAPTRLLVDDGAITVDAPAVLRGPLRLDREMVHSVYVFPDRVRTRSRSRAVGGGTVQQAAPEPTCWWVPDMGVGMDRPGLLIVLDPSLPMSDAVRRGTTMLLLFGFLVYRGPTRFTVARGLLFPLADAHQAVGALQGWPMPGLLDPTLRTWVDGDRVRGRWGWKKSGRPKAPSGGRAARTGARRPRAGGP